MPTIGWFNAMPPVLPQNIWLPKSKMPPSDATRRYPVIGTWGTHAGGGEGMLSPETNNFRAHDVPCAPVQPGVPLQPWYAIQEPPP